MFSTNIARENPLRQPAKTNTEPPPWSTPSGSSGSSQQSVYFLFLISAYGELNVKGELIILVELLNMVFIGFTSHQLDCLMWIIDC